MERRSWFILSHCSFDTDTWGFEVGFEVSGFVVGEEGEPGLLEYSTSDTRLLKASCRRFEGRS